MTKKIGVRELKNQTSSIVRQVREESAEYVITYRGLPVAVLRPIDEQEAADLKKQEAIESWHRLLALGKALSESKISEKSAVEILEEMREEENQWPL